MEGVAPAFNVSVSIPGGTTDIGSWGAWWSRLKRSSGVRVRI